MPGPGHPLQLALGLTLWSLGFVGLYAGLSLGCALLPAAAQDMATWLNGALGLFSLLLIGLLLYLAWHCWQARRALPTRPQRFVAHLGAAQHLLAALALLFVSIPLARLPPCL